MLPILMYGFHFIRDITLLCEFINEVYVSFSQISRWLQIHHDVCFTVIWYVILKLYLEMIAILAI